MKQRVTYFDKWSPSNSRSRNYRDTSRHFSEYDRNIHNLGFRRWDDKDKYGYSTGSRGSLHYADRNLSVGMSKCDPKSKIADYENYSGEKSFHSTLNKGYRTDNRNRLRNFEECQGRRSTPSFSAPRKRREYMDEDVYDFRLTKGHMKRGSYENCVDKDYFYNAADRGYDMRCRDSNSSMYKSELSSKNSSFAGSRSARVDSIEDTRIPKKSRIKSSYATDNLGSEAVHYRSKESVKVKSENVNGILGHSCRVENETKEQSVRGNLVSDSQYFEKETVILPPKSEPIEKLEMENINGSVMMSTRRTNGRLKKNELEDFNSQASPPVVVKRGPGRPPKNRKKISNVEESVKTSVSVKGSESKEKVVAKKERKNRLDKDITVLPHKKHTRLAEGNYAAELRLAIEMSMKDVAANPELALDGSMGSKNEDECLKSSVNDSPCEVKPESTSAVGNELLKSTRRGVRNANNGISVSRKKTSKRGAVADSAKLLKSTKLKKTRQSKKLDIAKHIKKRRGKARVNETVGRLSVEPLTENNLEESEKPHVASSLKMLILEEYLDMSERIYCGKSLSENGAGIYTRQTQNSPRADDVTQEAECVNEKFESPCSNLDVNYLVSFDLLRSDLRQPQVIDLWGPKEIVLFELAIFKHGKEFHKIQRIIPTKTVKEIVDMYYLWKKTSRYRLWKSNRCY